MFLRGQNEAARGGEIIGFHCPNLADHDGRRAALQRFFHGPKRLFGARRMNEKKASRIDSVKGEPSPIKRTLFERGKILADPDDRRPHSRGAQTSGKRQRETCRGGVIAGLRRNDFVQRAEIEAAGQHAVEADMAERNAPGRRRRARPACRIFDPGNVLAQKAQPRVLSERPTDGRRLRLRA